MGFGIGGGGNTKKTTKYTDNTRNLSTQSAASGNDNKQYTSSFGDFNGDGISVETVDFGAVDAGFNLASMSLQAAAAANMKAMEQNEKILTANFDQSSAVQKQALDIAGKSSGAMLTDTEKLFLLSFGLLLYVGLKKR